jgi:hypothetical protein
MNCPRNRWGQSWPRLAAAMGIVWVAAAAGGCLFQPREAGPPGEKPPVRRIQFTDPESVLTQVEITLEAKYVPFYQDCFFEQEVLMEMDPGEAGGLSISLPAFPDWTRQAEAGRMRDVLSSMGTDRQLDVIWGDTEGKWRTGDYYEGLEYTLVFTQGVEAVTYEGRVDLYYKQVGGLYYIWRWVDTQQTQDFHTWCYLRYYGEWNHAGSQP